VVCGQGQRGLLGGRTPAELLHDVISSSPVFRGFNEREVAHLAEAYTCPLFSST
jgi:hypothetical protein